MNVDVAIAGCRCDELSHPGMLRPFPQSVWPTQGPTGTLVQVGGFQLTGALWVRVGAVTHTAANAGLQVLDDARLTFTTLPGPTGTDLDIVVGTASNTDAAHTGVLPARWRNTAA
jgi:hypothetical protein